jgi:CRP/FNR family cyclic AMP-dependent transcriptional regulator
MDERIRSAELFTGLSAGRLLRLSTIGRPRTLRAGEYLFLLGDSAQHLCVVVSGQIELCFPISVGDVVKDIAVESAGPGKTVGWSALVKPFHFTLSARAAEPTEVVAFGRHDLLQVFESDQETRRTVVDGISELIANRLSMFQALWARELQRRLTSGGPGATI